MTKAEAESQLVSLLAKMEARLTGETAEATKEPEKKKRKRLPSDPDRRARKLSLARMPARITVAMFDEGFRALGSHPLSKQEREEGMEAWAALYWYFGLTHPLVLVCLWFFGVIAPRTIDWLEDRRRQRENKPLPDRSRARDAEKPALVNEGAATAAVVAAKAAANGAAEAQP